MRPKKRVKDQLGAPWKPRELMPPVANIAMANKRTPRTTKFTTKMTLALTVDSEAMAKILPLKQGRMTARPMVRLVPTAVVPTTLRLYSAARLRQTSRLLPYRISRPEKWRMLSLTPSALPLVSARPETDVRYT